MASPQTVVNDLACVCARVHQYKRLLGASAALLQITMCHLPSSQYVFSVKKLIE